MQEGGSHCKELPYIRTESIATTTFRSDSCYHQWWGESGRPRHQRRDMHILPKARPCSSTMLVDASGASPYGAVQKEANSHVSGQSQEAESI